jgi:hypothetical protein
VTVAEFRDVLENVPVAAMVTPTPETRRTAVAATVAMTRGVNHAVACVELITRLKNDFMW